MRIPEWVAPYVGIAYKSGVSTRAAADCWGLFTLVQREQFGRDLADYDGPLWTSPRDSAAIGAAAEAFAKRFQQVEPGLECAGDAVLLNMLGVPIHIGVVVAPSLMLHVERATQSCVASYRSSIWAPRIAGFYRGA